MADMVASVPELTSRTISIEGTASRMASASSTSCGVGAPKLVPMASAFSMRRENLRMAVPQQQRSPGADVIDVLVAVDVEKVRALAARDEGRIPADAAERAHRRVDAARNDLLRFPKELFRFGMVHGFEGYGAGYPPALRGTRRLNPKLIPMS